MPKLHRLKFAAVALSALLSAEAAGFAQAPAADAATASVVHAAFPTGEATPLGRQIAALLARPGVSRAHWGIAVTAMDGTPLYGLNEGQMFRPASNAKLFTTAAAMALLGPEATVETTATSQAAVSADGTLNGDLRLMGGGDANLSGRAIPYVEPAERRAREAAARATGTLIVAPDPLRFMNELADKIAQAGVKRVNGHVVGDDTVWPEEPYATGWGTDDMDWGYGAPVSALAVDDNQLELTVTPGAGAGQPAMVSVTPDVGFYQLQASVMTVAHGAPDGVGIGRAPGSRTVRVFGTIGEGRPYETEIAVSDPAAFAAMALDHALAGRGIEVKLPPVAAHREDTDAASFGAESHAPLPTLTRGSVSAANPACTEGCPLRVALTSPTLAEDIDVTLKVSQNLHAEMMLRRMGKAYGSDGSFAQGTRVVRQWLIDAGLDGDDFVFYDGSGLSSHDLVTPRAVAQLLAYAPKQPWFAQWKAGLPVGGEDGTLAERFPAPPLKDHLFAKTGTLGESRALSGYVDAASGREIIFSILVDDHTPVSHADRTVMDEIVAAVAAAE